MLKLTRKVEYALIALRHMQQKPKGTVTNTKEISVKYGIPPQILAKTLQQLSRENVIVAVQGPTGGYKITSDLTEINMIEFFEKLEGPLGMMNCFYDSECIQLDSCTIKSPMEHINDKLRDFFSKMTLNEVTARIY